MGVEPVRVDIMSGVSSLDFPGAWGHRSEARFDEVIAPVLSIDDLIRAKRAAGSAKDRLQARQLEKAKALKRDRATKS